MNPKVSVIITTFRRPQFLREAIEGVLSQNFKDFEFIIVNDDPAGREVEEIISSFKDLRIVYVKNKENLGSAKSLNVGLRKARGKYVAILDDDDAWISNEKLGRQVKFLEENPEHVLVGANVMVVDTGSGREIVKSKYPFADDELRKIVFKSNPFAHSSVMFRKNAAEAVGGYDESLPRGKDYDLWLKLAKIGKVSVLPDYFLKYREVIVGQKGRNVIATRLKDAKFKLKVIWRYRKEYPHSIKAVFIELFRYLVFGVLQYLPNFVQKFLFKLKSSVK